MVVQALSGATHALLVWPWVLKIYRCIRALRGRVSSCKREGVCVCVMCSEKFPVLPGDIVVLRTGDKVPADIRLYEINELNATEKMLTGELGLGG